MTSTIGGDASERRGRPHFDETLGGWVVTRHTDARRILQDSEAFSASAYGRLEPNVSGSHLFFLADEPSRARLRRAFARAVTRSFVEEVSARALTPVARSVVERHTEAFALDPVEDLARPYARATLFEITGIKPQIGDALVVALRMAHENLIGDGAEAVDSLAAVQVARDLALEGLLGPGTSPWSLRSRLHADGNLSSSEQIACLMPLFETLAVKVHRDLPVSLLRQLARLPAERQRKILAEGQLQAAAEETVRLQPGGIIPRTVMREVDIGGVQVTAGDLVLVSLSDANTDPLEFSCPEAFDPARHELDRHQGFGAGNRVCVARRLAKALAVCLAEQCLRRWELSTIPSSSLVGTSVRQSATA